jgi:hypothetical protein
MAPRRTLFLASLWVAFAAPACRTVIVLDEDGGADPEPLPRSCGVDPADLVDVRSIESASLIDTALHVEGSIGGKHDYAILQPTDHGVAKLLEVRPDLLGGAAWTQYGADPPEQLYARARGSTLDVLRANAKGAALVASHDLGAPVLPGAEAIATSPGRLYVCLDTGETPALFHEFDTSAPLALAPLGPSEACEIYGGEASASWFTWVNWGATEVRFRLLGSETGTSHAWAPDGVHAYGELTAVATDGDIIAVTLENDDYAFLYYPEDEFVVYSSFGSGDKKLLAVNSRRAIVALPDPEGARIVSFVLDPPPAWETAVPRGDLDAVLRGVSGDFANLEMLAHDGNHAVISDGLNLFVVSIVGETVNDPLLVVREGANLPCEH